MSVQKYFSTRITELLDKVNRDLFIPSIQRPYVWEPEQILRLFDSLMRGYPISTFLTWELQPQNVGDWDIYRFVDHFRQGDIHNEPATLDANRALTLVLDGQQRLTSLLIGLSGSYTVRNGVRGKGAGWVTKILLLDLFQSPDVQDIEEDDDAATARELYYGFKFAPIERLPKSDEQNLWFKVADIRDVRDRDQLGACLDRLLMLHPDLSEEQQSLVRSNVTRLWQVVHEEECLAYYMEREQSYDKVLDIFIRANDGGTKLSRSDLLMSMVTLRWSQFNARSETEAVTYKLRKLLDQETAFERDYLLRAGLFFNDLDFGFQLRNFTPRNIALVESTWSEVTHALQMAAELFKKFGITGGTLTGVNAVMLVGCFIYKQQRGKALADWSVSEADQDRIRRWIGAVLFHGVLSGAANVSMEYYRRTLNDRMRETPDFPVAAATQRMAVRGRKMSFDDEAVGRFFAQEPKSRTYRTCLQLLYSRVDWSAGDWQLVQIIPSHRLEEDRLRHKGVASDEIGALQSWSARLGNQMLLSHEEADAYYSMDLGDWVRSRSDEFRQQHCLPDSPELFNELRFLEFLQARRALIRDRLQTVLLDDAPVLKHGVVEPEADGTLAPAELMVAK